MMKLCALLTSLVIAAYSYDTGHHSDLTRNAMEVHGYNTNAQLAGAVSNWYVDYFSYTLGFEDIPALTSMHFDNLQSLPNISNYLTRLVHNTRNATRIAVTKNDPVTFIAVMGASLHAIQDFYTHSSWPEHHQIHCGCYRDDTWFSDLASVNGNITELLWALQGVKTYSWGNGCNEFERNCEPGQITHGDYCEGVNKDSYVRPWFEKSYGHAFAASVEWIYNIHKWANEFGQTTLIERAQNYNPTGEDAFVIGINQTNHFTN
eukprot:TRINITY_DN9029_c0_g1_i2.p1 TRINITY_DN9029_c0_g1~~TRINITY_DN9029_c0_g1_i2.p1  ORF type:complete len:262 (+),score=56.31 TRINITY_DN9029_c0_g1_i2:364-1149(+)